MEIKRTNTFGHTDYYTINGNVTPYTDEQLLDMCDRNNFGGYIRRGQNGATATVYTD